MTMRQRLIRLAQIAIGIFVVITLFQVLVQLRVVASLLTGVPIRHIREIERLAQKAERGEPLSPHEVDRLAFFVKEYEPYRHTVLIALWHMGCPEKPASKWRQTLGDLLDDPDRFARHISLLLLWNCGDPKAKQVAAKMLNDPDKRVRQTAQMILREQR